MANVQPYIDQILAARYGRDVRQSIADGIGAINVESEEARTVAITSQESAQSFANSARESATEATTQASNALMSATDAQSAKADAESAKADAETSAFNAAQSASSANASKEAAYTSEINAQMSANNANNSEVNAKASETSAAASATRASNNSEAANQYATSAAQSASSASASQTASADSARSAEKSANDARGYAEQAQAIANIDTMTASKNGIGRPDGSTITVNEFGVFSAKGITEHANRKVVSNDGVHGIRIQDGELEKWSEDDSTWTKATKYTSLDDVPTATADTLGLVKVDDKTIHIDEDGMINADLSVVADEYGADVDYGLTKKQYCIYNNVMYKAKTDTVPRGTLPTNTTYFEATSAESEFTKINASLTENFRIIDSGTKVASFGGSYRYSRCGNLVFFSYASSATQLTQGQSYDITLPFSVPFYAVVPQLQGIVILSGSTITIRPNTTGAYQYYAIAFMAI